VIRGGYYGRYHGQGVLTYANDGAVFAVRFDPISGELQGSPVPVITNITADARDGGIELDVSASGRAIYHTGGGAEARYPALWVDGGGRSSELWNEPGSYAEPRVSPDGNRVSFMAMTDDNWDVWAYDLSRDVATRLTFAPALDGPGVWSPDGDWIAFSSSRGGAGYNIYRKRSDGSGEAERLTEVPTDQFLSDWSTTGHLVFAQANDLWTYDLATGESTLFLESDFSTTEAAFSPDGRFIAYASNESGRSEVYVQPFPASGGKWQVSAGGGNYPRWSAEGDRLYYRSDAGIMVAGIDGGDGGFRAGRPSELFNAAYRGGINGMSVAGLTMADYAVDSQRERFVMFPIDQDGILGVELITLETGWIERVLAALGGNR
jgi:hypothetical protein